MTIYYLFIGENATTGQPHPTTGGMNIYGDILAFSSKEKRDRYYNEYRCEYSEFVEKCGRTSARKYCLGMSVLEFNNYMDESVYLSMDDRYNSYFE